jgi:hypothetical protein
MISYKLYLDKNPQKIQKSPKSPSKKYPQKRKKFIIQADFRGFLQVLGEFMFFGVYI